MVFSSAAVKAYMFLVPVLAEALSSFTYVQSNQLHCRSTLLQLKDLHSKSQVNVC